MSLRTLLHRDIAHRQADEHKDAQLVNHWRNELERLQRHPVTQLPVVMFDTIEPEAIPDYAQAVAGYTGGRWPTFPAVVKLFPRAHHVSIAVSADEDATMLDVETGDASPSQSPRWVRRQWSRGVERPILYGSRSTMREILLYLHGAGIPRARVRLLVADPTDTPHIPPGFDGCQWTWHANGLNLDESKLVPDFFA